MGAEADALLNAITKLCNRIFQQGMPEEYGHIFFGANLTALRKPDGGVRPVAVGLVLRRLCSKLATFVVRNEAANYLRPHQVGFGLPGGCEAAVHATRSFIKSSREVENPFVLLKVDFANAFNTIRRDMILREVFRKFPQIYQYVVSSYGAESSLLFGSEVIKSAEGVQQGDPLGPFLFALTIQPMVESIQSPLNCWYLDDGTLAGDPSTVEADLIRIKEIGQNLGLKLNVDKCEVASQNWNANLDSPLSTCKQIEFHDLMLLGAPLGVQAETACMADKIATLSRFSSRLKLIQPHQAFFLLKNSMSLPRINYILRTSNMSEHRDLATYDNVLRETLEDILNVHLNDTMWKQATLPVKHGGLGLRSAADVSLPAFISSCMQSRELSFEISGLEEIAGIESATALWAQVTGGASHPDSCSQEKWDSPLIDRAKNLIIASAVDDTNRARLLAATSGNSGDWLNALPIPTLGLLLSESELRISVSLRLGTDIVHPHACVACGDEVRSIGIHGLSCRSSAGRMPRHSAANDIIKRALSSAIVPSVLEPTGLSRQDGRRPDGLTLIPWSQGKCLVWDFTCCDTVARSNVQGCAQEASSAANAAEQRKLSHYSDLSSNYFVVPVAVETYGSLGTVSTSFIKELSKRLIVATGDNKSGSYFRQRLSIVIQRGNALAVMGTMERGESLLDESEYRGHDSDLTLAETDTSRM